MDASEIHSEKTQCEGSNISQESIVLEEIRTCERPPRHGITQFEEKVFFLGGDGMKEAISHTQNCLPLPRILTEQLSQVWRLTPSPTPRLALGKRLHQRRREKRGRTRLRASWSTVAAMR